ncbi:MAG: ThuA domain-containing protein [Candidatus Hydrogenedens sp.]|jgi:type 1 glutamine amidotransferase|nr:ThuA domain-containing protein [Candidatus Hydrogenedens sp.]
MMCPSVGEIKSFGFVTLFFCFLFQIACGAAPAESTVITSEDPHCPEGYVLTASLTTHPNSSRSSAESERIMVDSAAAELSKNVAVPWNYAWTSTERIGCIFSGLDPEADYILGLSWWDAAEEGIVQSVQFSSPEDKGWQTAVPAAPAAAFSGDRSVPAKILLPIPQSGVEGGIFHLSILKEEGPHAVLQAVSLFRLKTTTREKKILIITGDDYGGHDWVNTAPALARVLREDPRLEVTITESPAMTGSPWLAFYDAVVLHFKNYDQRLLLAPSSGEALRNYVASGKGLLLSHFACGAFENWPPFEKIAGRIWNPELRAHDPYGVFQVRMTEEKHLITQGLTDFQIQDELYTCLDGQHEITVLCDALSVVDEKVYPIAFIVENTEGRVFHCLLGHDTQVYDNEDAAALYRRAALWAVGLIGEE